MDLRRDLRFLKSKLTRGNVAELIWVFAGQAVTLVMSFLILKVLTQMGKEAFGEYTLTLTLSAFLGLILYGPFQQGFIRYYYHHLGEGRARLFVTLLYRFLGWSSGSFLLLGLLVGGLALALGGRHLAVLALVGAFYIVCEKANEFFNGALNVIRKRKENYILQGTEKLLAGGALLALYRAGWLSVTVALAALGIVMTLALVAKVSNYARHLPEPPPLSVAERRRGRRQMLSQLWGYVLPFVVWGVAGWLQLNSEKWILAQYLSRAEVGVYAVMFTVVNLLLIIPNNMLMEYITPIVFRHYADLSAPEELKIGHRYIQLTVLCVVGLTAMSAGVSHLVGRWIIVLISTEAYAGHSQLLPLLAAGNGLFFVGQAMCAVGLALGRPGVYLAPKIGVGLLSVATNVLFIRAHGVAGIAYSAIVIGGVYLLAIGVVNRRLLH